MICTKKNQTILLFFIRMPPTVFGNITLKKEGAESVTNCNQLKLHASDGKLYKTDVADTEGIFRIIQSIPSPKAEPFKI